MLNYISSVYKMKTKLHATLCFTLNVLFLNAQTLTDVARSNALTWYGIDFTQARFLNFTTSQTVGDLSEEDKSLVKRKFKKKYFDTDFTACQKRNSALDYNKITSNGAYEIDAETVKKVVSEYDIKGTGYGMLFVVESFEKTRSKGYIWIAYFNKADKKIISITRYTGFFDWGDAWKQAIINVIKASGKDLTAYK